MGKVLCILICFLIFVPSRAQVNLILNPSFEILDSCPSGFGQIDRAKQWNVMNSTSNFLCWGTLIHTCCIYPASCGVNAFSNGGTVYQFPRTGNGYCMMEISPPPPPNAGLTNFRTYIIGKLNNTLTNGKSYCGKVYINLDNLSPYKINRFGMYFDNGTIFNSQPNCFTVLNVTPQVENNPLFIMNDTLGWMSIQGIFTANGTESRITLGNFYTDVNSVGLPTGLVNGRYPATYNIDDISLIATDITAFAGNDVTICVSDSIHLGRPQEVGLECLWYKPTIATSFANTSDIWFKPIQTGVYTFVQRMDNCAITWDTVTVTVIQDCNTLGAEALEAPNVFTPNGDGTNDTFMFSVFSAKGLVFNIYDRWGLLIKNSELKTNNYVLWDGRTTSGEACSEGVYFYTLQYTDSNGDVHKKNGYVSLFR
jgi:gliding motility-associated-like protein